LEPIFKGKHINSKAHSQGGYYPVWQKRRRTNWRQNCQRRVRVYPVCGRDDGARMSELPKAARPMGKAH